MSPLSGPAQRVLHEAILAAFNLESLERLTKFNLDLDLGHIWKSPSLSDVVFKLIAHCEQNGLTEALLNAIAKERLNLANLKEQLAAANKLGIALPPVVDRGVFQLPPGLRDFTGRKEEIDRITARLRGGGGPVGVSSALRGMGGIGKTVTAVVACHAVKDNFPDGQLVVELRGMSKQPLTPVRAMSHIIYSFLPNSCELPDEEAELLPQYRRVLAGKRALVLLDDAKDEAQVRSLLDVEPPAAFVVTSRNALALTGVESIRLGVLPPDEALTLLRDIVGTKGTDDELQTVAELCGRLPLALRVAADFLRTREDWTLAEYISALEAERLRWLKIGEGVGEDVEASLRLSSAMLVQENLALADRWHLLHIFPGSFDIPAVAKVWDMSVDDRSVHDGLSTLTRRSLLLFDGTTRRYQFHDLMRPIAENLFGEAES